MAPSTPPPPSRLSLAALTIASTCSRVMSPCTISRRTARSYRSPPVACDHAPVRLRRSILSVPGSEQRMLTKAAGLAPDIVMLDLEDAVVAQRKDEARGLVVDAIARLEWTAVTVAVRINPVGSRWCLDDVSALLDGAGP